MYGYLLPTISCKQSEDSTSMLPTQSSTPLPFDSTSAPLDWEHKDAGSSLVLYPKGRTFPMPVLSFFQISGRVCSFHHSHQAHSLLLSFKLFTLMQFTCKYNMPSQGHCLFLCSLDSTPDNSTRQRNQGPLGECCDVVVYVHLSSCFCIFSRKQSQDSSFYLKDGISSYKDSFLRTALSCDGYLFKGRNELQKLFPNFPSFLF